MEHGLRFAHEGCRLQPPSLRPYGYPLRVVVELRGANVCVVANTSVPFLRQMSDLLRPQEVEQDVLAFVDVLRSQYLAASIIEEHGRCPLELRLVDLHRHLSIELLKNLCDIPLNDHVRVKEQRIALIPTQPRNQEPRVRKFRQPAPFDRELCEDEGRNADRTACVTDDRVLEDVIGDGLSRVVSDEDPK